MMLILVYCIYVSTAEVLPLNTDIPDETAEEFTASKDMESEVLVIAQDAEADADLKKFEGEKELTFPENLNCNVSKEELGLEVAAPVDFSVPADDKNEKPACEKLSKSPLSSLKGTVFASILADDEFLPDKVASPIHSTAVKKSSTKAPTMNRLIHVGDDKENVDNNGVKFELTKEKAKTNKKDDLTGLSLRHLTKMLKEMQISKNKTVDANDEKLTAAAKV